jgi:hypothetical protein
MECATVPLVGHLRCKALGAKQECCVVLAYSAPCASVFQGATVRAGLLHILYAVAAVYAFVLRVTFSDMASAHCVCCFRKQQAPLPVKGCMNVAVAAA